MDEEGNTITITLPRGDLDSIESLETRVVNDTPGVYELLVNNKPGRLMIDFSQFTDTEEDDARLIIAVRTAFYKHHRAPVTQEGN